MIFQKRMRAQKFGWNEKKKEKVTRMRISRNKKKIVPFILLPLKVIFQ